jgi:hypothetical protein
MAQRDDGFSADKAEATASGRTLEDISDRLEEIKRALSARISLIPAADLEPPEPPRP